MAEEKLFVYGTLLDTEVQRAVFGREAHSEPAILKGFLRSEVGIGNRTYPILLESTDHDVEGIVLTITPYELEKIDNYETSAYRRVRAKTNRGIEVWVYCK